MLRLVQKCCVLSYTSFNDTSSWSLNFILSWAPVPHRVTSLNWTLHRANRKQYAFMIPGDSDTRMNVWTKERMDEEGALVTGALTWCWSGPNECEYNGILGWARGGREVGKGSELWRKREMRWEKMLRVLKKKTESKRWKKNAGLTHEGTYLTECLSTFILVILDSRTGVSGLQ